MDEPFAPFESIGPRATVAEAASRMQARHVSALVVLEDGALVGILTERDLVQVLIDGDDPSQVPVSRRMSTELVTIGPDAEPMEARELMGRYAVRHLPVVDGGRVVGIIEQAEPRVGLNFGGRRSLPDGEATRPVIEDFRGRMPTGHRTRTSPWTRPICRRSA